MSEIKHTHYLAGFLLLIALFFFYFYFLIESTPSNFPLNKNFVVEENETLKKMSIRLKSDGYITSSFLFRLVVSSEGKDRDIKAGGYSFSEKRALYGVVEKFTKEKPDIPLLSVTIPEGSTVEEIASLVHKAIPSIKESLVLSLIEEKKLAGKLFPSTYFLLPSNSAESIIKIMRSTFETKYESFIKGKVLPSPLKNDEEVLSLAAILEGEAKNKEDMQMVAGILLSRLQKDMLLQVDVATSTYTKKGLPSYPINNPGEIAIYAVLHPKESPYLFYLTGKNGSMYYAKTFEEHKRNIQKYLR